ncbi:unnamed protein product [Phytophthora lilii]|uniref:Unnamed protein product n=1 Tax=Phytophthora lilii TaxID=2077276 RepID=A0A9W6X4K1_9STRA|nr:unnamed protein product [Phytophthora lilii]
MMSNNIVAVTSTYSTVDLNTTRHSELDLSLQQHPINTPWVPDVNTTSSPQASLNVDQINCILKFLSG